MTKKELEAKVAELEAFQANRRKRQRDNFKAWLDKGNNREEWNAKMRARYAAKKK